MVWNSTMVLIDLGKGPFILTSFSHPNTKRLISLALSRKFVKMLLRWDQSTCLPFHLYPICIPAICSPVNKFHLMDLGLLSPLVFLFYGIPLTDENIVPPSTHRALNIPAIGTAWSSRTTMIFNPNPRRLLIHPVAPTKLLFPLGSAISTFKLYCEDFFFHDYPSLPLPQNLGGNLFQIAGCGVARTVPPRHSPVFSSKVAQHNPHLISVRTYIGGPENPTTCLTRHQEGCPQ